MQRFALIFCICCHAALAQAASYTYQLIDYPGASRTFVNGINNSGTIVGSFQSEAGRHGFLYDGSTYTEFNYPGATWTELNGINNLGHLVGSYRNGDHSVGFVFDGTDFETFSVEGGVVVPRDLNDLGQVVGHYLEEIGLGLSPKSGFLWHNGAFSFVEIEGADVSWIEGINNLGQFVGGYRQSDSLLPNAFRWTGDAFDFIEVPGHASYLAAINSAGALLAQAQPSRLVWPNSSTVYLSLNGDFAHMDVPAPYEFGESFAFGEDLNDQGYFVGSYRDGNSTRGYLAIPVPEPATGTLVAIAALTLLAHGRRNTNI